MQQHGSKRFVRRPLPLFRKGPQVKIQFFQNMVMLHIKFIGITKCSNMVANILPADPSPPPYSRNQKVKIQLFQNNIMLLIKLKGITNAATWSQMFYLQTPPPPILGMGSIGQKSQFSEYGHVAYQITENH